MASWFDRIRGVSGGVPHDSPTEARKLQRRVSEKPGPPDPNAPVRRLQMHQRCLYERTLPGEAFVSAHVNRLQHGFYETSALHEPALEDVYFVSVHFVFHPCNPRSHRFRSAAIRVSIHGSDPAQSSPQDWDGPSPNPRILKHAPELIYGAVSPENLQWNFSLSSSLGVSQAPLSATVNPQGGVKSSYKVYDMMSIQGSVRTTRSPLGPTYDVEDGTAVWTLEENKLQRSGLPRDFDFVLLVHKPADVKDIYMTVDVDANVENWFGLYPRWYTNLAKYMPSQDFTLNFDADIGQRFLPTHPERGFNFADLPQALEEYVQMPGTTYPTNVSSKCFVYNISTVYRAFCSQQNAMLRSMKPLGPFMCLCLKIIRLANVSRTRRSQTTRPCDAPGRSMIMPPMAMLSDQPQALSQHVN
jgi:hypothetical protein